MPTPYVFPKLEHRHYSHCMSHQTIYHRKLPHIQALQGTFFVTYRLYGTLPAERKQQLREELLSERKRLERSGCDTADALDKLNRRYFGRFDQWLDAGHYGPSHLKIDLIAQSVMESLHYWANSQIELIAYVIMSNHVHVVFTLLSDTSQTGRLNLLKHLMQSIKSYSGRKANKLLSLTGKFWEEESYDRLVRNDAELIRIIQYVLTNPVKAGLCQHWRQWPWVYIKSEYDMF